jgi:thiamine transporter
MQTNYSSEYSNNNSFRNPKVLAEMAIFVALATALSFIVVYTLPQGGSITAASMVPIIWLALRRGPKVGITAGILYGLIQFAILPFIAPVPYSVIQVLLDYPFAFGVLGIAGLFQQYPVVGAAVGITGRFIMHFASGVFFWAVVEAPSLNPWVYSAVYNGSYLLPELVISGFVLLMMQKSKVLKVYL